MGRAKRPMRFHSPPLGQTTSMTSHFETGIFLSCRDALFEYSLFHPAEYGALFVLQCSA
jgi:hypothetical protein